MNGADDAVEEKPKKKAAAPKKAPAGEKKLAEKKAPAKKRAPKKVWFPRPWNRALYLMVVTERRRVWRGFR
jgi:hypothetical protein